VIEQKQSPRRRPAAAGIVTHHGARCPGRRLALFTTEDGCDAYRRETLTSEVREAVLKDLRNATQQVQKIRRAPARTMDVARAAQQAFYMLNSIERALIKDAMVADELAELPHAPDALGAGG
jgi:hypothetical protein